MVNAGDLKSPGLRPCRFESCSGHQARLARLGAFEKSLPHVVGRQQVLERVAVEERGALVALFGPLDLDAVDLLGLFEDLADAQRLVLARLEDLRPQRIDDPVGAAARTTRADRIRRGSLCARVRGA